MLVRHAQPDWEPDGRAVDDPGLTAYGHRQAECTARALADETFDAIYVSTLRRVRETAEPIVSHHDVEPSFESWLREMGLASLEGQTSEQVQAYFAHAHARGVVHRDLKPANVLLDESEGSQQLWLTDFGIAHLARRALDRQGEPEEAFEEGSVLGTPGYMAPEQLRGEWREQGPWTDLYALGCLTWSLLVGREPFDTKKPLPALLYQVLTDDLPPLPPGAAPDAPGGGEAP